MNIVDDFYALVERGRKGENSSLPIGLPRMEEYIEGLSQGNQILIGAGSGVGKTTLLLYSYVYKPLMDTDNDKDLHIIFWNLEMSESQILGKLLSIYIYETYGEIISFKEMFSRGRDTVLSDDKYDLLKECRPILEIFMDRIIFHPGPLTAGTFDDVTKNDLLKFGRFEDGNYIPNNPKQIVEIIVDHLSLTRATQGRTKKEEMDQISNHAVSFRNKCKILTFVFLMQLNRNQFGNERLKNDNLREPDESDLKDSGTMLEDSMTALLLFSPSKAKLATHRGYDITELQDSYRSLKCIKNRFGAADVAIGLGFYGEIGVFKELPPSSQINDYEIYKDPSWSLQRNDNPESEVDANDINLTIVL